MLETLQQHQPLSQGTLSNPTNKLMSKDSTSYLYNKDQGLLEVLLLGWIVLIFNAVGELSIVEIESNALDQKVNLKKYNQPYRADWICLLLQQ